MMIKLLAAMLQRLFGISKPFSKKAWLGVREGDFAVTEWRDLQNLASTHWRLDWSGGGNITHWRGCPFET
jgi:hypothetical protein